MGHILVIDDEETVRGAFRLMLERAGHEVQAVCDGNDGLRSFRESLPDVVITDLLMPDKEGIEMIMEMRRERPEVKIIAISGGGRVVPETYLEIARVAGAARTFAKPVSREELLAAVGDLLGEGDEAE